MRTNALLLAACALAAGCNGSSTTGGNEPPGSPDDGADGPAKTAADATAGYEELRAALEAKRTQLASDVRELTVSPSFVYFTHGPGSVLRATGGQVGKLPFATDLGIAASDTLVAVQTGGGWTAHGGGGEVLGAIDVDAKDSRFTHPTVEGASVYFHALTPSGERSVYRWTPGTEPEVYARLPKTGLLPLPDGGKTMDGNLNRIGVSGGSVYVLLFAPGIVYAKRADALEVSVAPVGSSILSAAFYDDGVLVGSQTTVAELAHVRADTGAVTKPSDLIAKAGAPDGLAPELASIKDYAAGGERVGPFTVYVGGSTSLGTSGVFAFDERSGRIIPIALAPLAGGSRERFESVHVTSDGGAYITSLVDGARVLSHVDAATVLAY